MVKMGQKLTQEEKIANALLKRKLRYAKMLTKRSTAGVKPKKGRRARPRKLSLKKLVTKADELLSVFIRKRDGKCVLCGATTKLTNGHLIKRGKKPVRWSPENCFCLCSTCNYRDKVDSDYHGRYVAWYVEKFGLSAYTHLEELARQQVDSTWIRETALLVIQTYGPKEEG